MDEKQFLAKLKEIASTLSEGNVYGLLELRKLERKLELIKIFKGWGNKISNFLHSLLSSPWELYGGTLWWTARLN